MQCRYWNAYLGWCNYIDVEKKSRVKSGGKLMPNGGCKLFVPAGSAESPKNNWNARPRKVVADPLPANVFRQMEYLYRQGLMDREIARELGIGATTVARWRKKNNLESNYHRK